MTSTESPWSSTWNEIGSSARAWAGIRNASSGSSLSLMSRVLRAEQLDDADAGALADRDRLGARDQAVVDADVERGAGRFVEGDDRAGPEAGRELADVE